jgi:hypothetical protein
MKQPRYVLDENEIIGKGPNGTLRLIFDGIKNLNKGEKHLKFLTLRQYQENKPHLPLKFHTFLIYLH